MRERKYIKFRVDMHEDTKLKIIDRMPERDLVQYLWTRFVALAAKVNRDGDLYLSKNIPYTIETLAIEFNRSTDQVKIAVDVFMQLEMLEFTGHNVYIVKNFAKHQNIKVKEKIKPEVKEEEIKNKEIQVKEILENKTYEVEDKEPKSIISKNEKFQEKNLKSLEIVKNNEVDNNKNSNNLKIGNKDNSKVDNNMCNEKSNNNSQDNVPILLEVKKKNNKTKGRKKKDTPFEITDEEIEKDPLSGFWEGDERPLEEGESVVSTWAF